MRTQVLRNFALSRFVATLALLFVIGFGQAVADVIYSTDFVESPASPAEAASDKGTFNTGGTAWSNDLSDYFLTTGSAGQYTLNFPSGLDLSASSDVKLKVYWGATSNRPLNVTINGGSPVEIDKVATSSDRSILREAEADIAETSISSIKFSSSGGGNVYLYRLEISGASSGPNASLSSILVNGEPLNGFSSNKYDYNVSLILPTDDNGNIEWPTLTATLASDESSFEQSSTLVADNQMQYVFTVTNADAQKVYTIVITAKSEDEVLSDEAHLAEIRVDGTPLSGFSQDKFSYTIEVTSDAKGEVTCTPMDGAANASVTAGSPAADGSVTYTINVVAEDGTTTLKYTVVVTRPASVTPGGGEVPATSLTCHRPEIYEAMTTFGGYGGELTIMNGREYEVYYITRSKTDGSNNNSAIAVYPQDDAPASVLVSTNETKKSFDSKDGWFIGRSQNEVSSPSDQGTYDEFKGTHARFKMRAGDTISMHVSGFDQFRLLAKDKKLDTSSDHSKPQNDQFLDVYIDGVKQTTTHSTEVSVRTYNMTSGEHVISVRATGTGDSEAYAWSLRLTNNPLVKHLSGNDSSQVVNQTQAIAPVRYAIKNFVASNLKWNGNSIPGVTLKPVNAKGDTLQLSGIADAAVGNYSYTIEALDANGNVSTSIDGKISIKTELRADTTNATFWITDQVKFDFTYFALNPNDIHFTWTDKTPAGLKTSVTGDNTYSISGVPTAIGTYPYTISIDGGNTLSGTIIVEIPAPQLTAPVPDVAHAKPGQRIVDIVWGVRFASSATVTGLPNGLYGSYNNGKFTISGTPAVLANYPQKFEYTVTATPEYAEQTSTSAKGTIIVIDPNAKSLLYLYKDNYNDALFNYLDGRYDVTARKAEDKMRAANEYDYYNAIIISENIDADNPEALNIITSLNKPVLNMKAFTYASSRLGWGNPDNGSVINTSLSIIQPEHPIVAEYNYAPFDIMPILSDIDIRGIQPVGVTLKNTLCIAAAPTRGRDYNDNGPFQTAIHEIPGNLRGKGITARYLLLPISQRSYAYLNGAAQRLIDACISYLVDNKSGYTITLPTLQILSFNVAGVAATIDESAKTITCIVPDGTDLTSVAPAITLADNTTHTIPEIGERVDLSDSHFGFDYTVSDYINTVTYHVVCRTVTAIEENNLSGVYYDAASQMLRNDEGHLLYIYDVMGRLVNIANTSVSLSDLPHGLYLIQSHDAVKKILR